MKQLICLFTLFLCACNHQETKEKVILSKFKNYDFSAEEILRKEHINKKHTHIHIDKSAYKLSLKYGDQILKEYPVVFGENAIDDKRREGDMCTPEGKFKVRDLYPHKNWSKFIWIDYPTKESQRKFEKSKVNGEIPKDATIGGEVGIHGVPEGKDHLITDQNNWTWGCISLMNNDIEDLYSVCFKGMEIEIVK